MVVIGLWALTLFSSLAHAGAEIHKVPSCGPILEANRTLSHQEDRSDAPAQFLIDYQEWLAYQRRVLGVVTPVAAVSVRMLKSQLDSWQSKLNGDRVEIHDSQILSKSSVSLASATPNEWVSVDLFGPAHDLKIFALHEEAGPEAIFHFNLAESKWLLLREIYPRLNLPVHGKVQLLGDEIFELLVRREFYDETPVRVYFSPSGSALSRREIKNQLHDLSREFELSIFVRGAGAIEVPRDSVFPQAETQHYATAQVTAKMVIWLSSRPVQISLDRRSAFRRAWDSR